MRRKYIAVAVAALTLSGCAGVSQKVDTNVDQTESKSELLIKDVGHAAPAGVVGNATPTVVHENGVWLGKNVVKLGQPSLPAIFYEPATFDRTVASLSELAERLTLRSGIPTKVSSDALIIANGPVTAAPGSGSISSTNTPMALANSRSRAPIRITYAEGNFKGLLDTVAARYGVYWKYSNGIIQFYYTDSRTFQVTALPGDSTFSATVNSQAASTGGVASSGAGGGGGGAGGGGGGSGGGSSGVSSNNGQNTAINSQLSVYTSIEKTIIAMLSSHGKVVASPSTGSITVVDTPDSLDRIAEFMEAENKALSRQITINVTVLSVTLNQQDNYGIQWDLVYSNLLSNYGITNTVTAPTGASAFSAGILSSTNNKFAGSKLVIQALSQQGKVREETSASVVTLNNQPVPVQVATQTSYLASSQTTLTNTVGATTTLTPGVVTTGFNMSILPHVLNNGTVLLQFSTNISALNGLRTVPSGGSSIEVPTIDTRNFLQRVSMKSNETLIISGFEQVDDNVTRNGVGTPSNFLFGGGVNGNTEKQKIVILITPTTASS